MPPPKPGWADFSIMLECTPESGHCESSVYSVLGSHHVLEFRGHFTSPFIREVTVNIFCSHFLHNLRILCYFTESEADTVEY